MSLPCAQSAPGCAPFSLTAYHDLWRFSQVDNNQIVVKKRHIKFVNQLPRTRLITVRLMRNEKITPCQIILKVCMCPFYNKKPSLQLGFVTNQLVVFPHN